ncbi:hypothetical protein ACIJYF_00745 [Candidatus Pelagibacter bacterium nBUS_49]|uniref:hypothetical protein n=1 Tax=Candidatus Pelagibacter bacterium nBUS_49 TaxID=3374196 RepID=UPI003EC13757
MKKIARFLINFIDNINMCLLCLLYRYKYKIFNSKCNKILQIFLRLILKKPTTDNDKYSCQVKSSKIIFEKIDKQLIIFDRPIYKSYFSKRDQLSEFHQTPKYNKQDAISYWQEKIISNENLLSLPRPELFNVIEQYCFNQLEFKKKFGTLVSLSKFSEIPLQLFKTNKNIIKLGKFLTERINFMLKKNEKLILIPSVIEPWPLIKNNKMIFSDLSPVEFRNAPFFHDLFYMLFKFELYGSRKKKHKPILPIIYDALNKIEIGNEDEIIEKDIVNLAKVIYKFMKPQEFVNSYILMIFFHLYVKFEATGKFRKSSANQRLKTAIKRHTEIFKLVKC